MGEKFLREASSLKETGRKPVEQSPEELEQKLDHELEVVIAEHSEYVNEGNNGYILKVRLAELPEEERAVLELAGIKTKNEANNGADEKAMKLLKIHSAGHGREEFHAQRKAWELLERLPKEQKPNFARVPEPQLYRDIKISDEIKQLLSHRRISITGKQVEVIVMDYIEGKDLATIFYQWVLDHLPPEKQFIKQNTNPENFQQLHAAVATALDFKEPGGKSRYENEREAERRAVYNQNAEKLYSFLERTGFRLDERITAQIENAEKLLKANKVTHPDKHERNYMVSQTAEGPQVYIVDFGKPGKESDEGQIEFDIVSVLKRFSGGKQEESREEVEREKQQLEALKKQKKWRDQLQKLKRHIFTESNRPDADVIESLTANGMAGLMNETSLRSFVATLQELVATQQLTPEQAKHILTRMRESLVARTKSGTIKKIANPFAYNRIKFYLDNLL